MLVLDTFSAAHKGGGGILAGAAMIDASALTPDQLGVALALASDDDFAATWPRLAHEQQSAIPDAERRACIERYCNLTPWFGASIKRAERGASFPDSRATASFVDTVELIDGASIQPEAVQWLWEGFLARGKLHVLAGAPGTGKTMIALALAATVSTGGRWPDGTRCEPGNVLIWSAEDDRADTLVPRLIAMGADMGRVQFVGDRSTMEGRAPFDPSRDMPMLMRAIATAGEINLLIVDPIVSAVAGDSHKNAEVRRGLQPLVDAGQKLGAAVLGISHFSKGTAGRDVTERVTGSLAFGALARVVLAAAKRSEDDGGGRILARAKSNIGPDGGGFSYDLAPGTIAAHPDIAVHVLQWGSAIEGSARELLASADDTGDPEERTAVDDAKEFLRGLLADGPVSSKTVRADAEGAGHAWITVRKAQKALRVESIKEGMKGGWVWKLSPKMLTKAEDAPQNNVSTFGSNEHLQDVAMNYRVARDGE